MGLGKSVITLTAIHSLMLDRFDVHRVLVIAPLRVAGTHGRLKSGSGTTSKA